MKQLKSLLFLLILFSLSPHLRAQEDLLSMFEEEETTDYTAYAFKANRIILSQSIEQTAHGNLLFVIQHQFGAISGGSYEMWGLDQSVIRLGFNYGATSWLDIGYGRSSYNKTYDLTAKMKILRQSTGLKNMPISLTYFGGAYINSTKWEDPNRENYFSSRLSYAHQFLIARKFNDNLTLQLTPTMIHRNLVDSSAQEHDVFAIAAGGRMKLTKRFSINAEYIYLIPGHTADNFVNSFSLGFDLETGGHVFQIYVTNSRGMQEPQFVAETMGEWGKGDLHLAFNIHRTFVLHKTKSHKNKK